MTDITTQTTDLIQVAVGSLAVVLIVMLLLDGIATIIANWWRGK